MAEMNLPPDPPSRSWGSLQRFWRGQSLAARGRRASFWASVGVSSGYVIKLGSNLALTRLLSPEIFGLMALAQVFMLALKKFSNVGTGASVVRSERGDDPDFLNTAWTVQVIRGFTLAAITCALAWPVAWIYEQPILFPVLCTISVTAIFSGFCSISVPVANRKLMLWRLTLASSISQFLVALVTIFSAWMLQSVWALVIGGVLGSLLHMVMTHLILPPFPHQFRLERAALREIVVFGRWILLGTACAFIVNQGQQAIYGLLVPLEILGKISIAALIATVPLAFFQKFLGQVVFPSFSEIRRERPKQIPRVLRKVRLMVIFTFLPLMFALSFFAQSLIDLLYDDRYALAGVFLALIPLNVAITILTRPYLSLLLADGASGMHAFLMVLAAILSISGVVIGYFTYGIIGSFFCQGIALALHFGANSLVAQRRGYGTGLLDILALGLIGLFYAYTLMTLEVPEMLWTVGAVSGQG
jgi:O-antigen/teichoic acid export membrane protein